MAILAIPILGMRVQVESPEPPARGPVNARFAPVTQASVARLERSAAPEVFSSRCAPDSNLRVAGFKGLFYKPLERQVVLANTDIQIIGLFVFRTI
jgi:hypothetical protein